MPYLITTSLFPSNKGPEVAEKYLEAIKKYPSEESLATEIVPAAVKATHQGIKVVGISEVKEGKLEEAWSRLANIEAMFLNIPGYEYTIDAYFKVEEALAVIGMSLPE